MTATLYPYYEKELIFIRQLAQEFAKLYPAAAGRLLLEPTRSADPHTERLIESFALLSGRIHNKLDDEFPELTDALLGVLYPHYLAPVPSMALVQFELDPTRGQLPKGFQIAKHSRVQTAPIGNQACIFRTGYPVTLWPLEVTSAQLQSPPFPGGFSPPPRTAAALRIQFRVLSQMKFADLSLDKLRLYLSGENQIVASLYELLFNHVTQVVFRSAEEGVKVDPVVFTPDQVISPVGFEKEDALLPYPPRSFPGYRLLTEFFAFPHKYNFLDLGGWGKACQAGFKTKLEVTFFLNRNIKALEEWIEASTFRLGCTPIINLFEQVAEPIPVTQLKHEYRVVPNVGAPLGNEVYSIDSVSSTDPASNNTIEYQPFYSFRHGKDRRNQQAFWHAARRPALRTGDTGSEVFLSLVDLSLEPRIPSDATLIIHTTCTNRNLPNQLVHAGENLYLELVAAAPLQRIRCLRIPSSPLHPPLRRGAYWGLMSHLNLNHLSISDPVEGRHALQEILRLYDFSDPEAGQQQMAEVTRQIIEGIASVSSRRVVGRTGAGPAGGFCRGLEITIDFDEQKYVGTGMFLFASVLERFLGLYVSINSFTQFIAKSKQREGVIKKWPPRTADHQLL